MPTVLAHVAKYDSVCEICLNYVAIAKILHQVLLTPPVGMMSYAIKYYRCWIRRPNPEIFRDKTGKMRTTLSEAH